ncbi:high affinity immunoglobulin alpha and immunoglobulin mu Fc receptor [Puma concolor]|uniref:high affinity immunoglobulin alpha and immunoglobulin mu Fc receptor n=1 Tax=Puma concolor TaxID=9696 RepID=UPI000DF4678A|nr:high affinity immunoglobulin alpha and immunoglobulin mu Fc receptor [Puma concolor]
MDREASAKPGEGQCFLQVTKQRAGWKLPIFLTLCLLQGSALTPPQRRPHLRCLRTVSLPSAPRLWAKETLTPFSPLCGRGKTSIADANALKGPRLVSGEPGGTVTIQCHYAPLAINVYERKYWCRLSPLTSFCHTIVSTTGYAHLGYRGRVTFADFPQRGLFVVRLSQLSPDDVGRYRCGIGKRNDMFFFSMNLNVSAGLSSAVPPPTLAAGELVVASLGTATPVANRWTPATSRMTERQGTGFHRVALTPGTRKTTASAEGRQTPGTTGAAALGTGSRVESSVRTTVPIPESSASTIGDMSNTTEGVWVWDTNGSVGDSGRPSEEGREITTTEADRPQEEAEKVRTALDVVGKVIGTIRPTTLVSEKRVQEILQEATAIAKPQALGSIERTTPAAGVWTLGPSSIQVASEEGATAGDLDTPAGYSDPQATPSQAPAAGPRRPLGKGYSMKRASPGEKNISRILTPVSTVLFPLTLVALVLLQRRLRINRPSQETEGTAGVTLIQMTHFLELSLQPDQLPHVERKIFRDESPPQARLTVPERHPGPQGMEQ